MAIYAGQYGPLGLEYPDGRHAVGIYVPVYEPGTTDLATLYLNAQKSGLAPNPVTTDALGNIKFFAEPGEYSLGFGETPIDVVVDAYPLEPKDVLAWEWIQHDPAAIWECPHPLGFEPAGFNVFVDDQPTQAPVTYGSGRVFVHFGAPCTGLVKMS